MSQSTDDLPQAARSVWRERHGDRRIALQEKRYGIWQPITWAAVRPPGARLRARPRRARRSSAATSSRSSATTGRSGSSPSWPRSRSAALSVGIYPTSVGEEIAARPRPRPGTGRRRRGPGAGRQADPLRESGRLATRRARHLLRPARPRAVRRSRACSSSTDVERAGAELERTASRLDRRSRSPQGEPERHRRSSAPRRAPPASRSSRC